jgi:predicted nucleic acid-binding protein
MTVIDASVFIAMLNPGEVGHAASQTWFQRTRSSGQQISAPPILLAEAAAALSRGAGNPLKAHKAIQQLLTSPSIQLYAVTAVLAERAAVLAADYGIRGCDAVYVALAEQLGVALVTWDKQQLQRGTAVVTTHQP